jgi:hypothetical protein
MVCRGRFAQKTLGAPGEDHVVVQQEDHGHAPRKTGGEIQTVVEVGPVLQGEGRRVLDSRPVRERVGEGNPYLQNVGSGLQKGLPHLPCALQGRIATGQVRHKRRAP